jgi:hypothetical protein
MTVLGPTLEAFFTQHMAGQRQASPLHRRLLP